jgi:predicted ATP-grasp superfamily ATP-dependent carboligase
MPAISRWPHVVVLDPLVPGLALARRMTRLGARVTVIEERPYASRSRHVDGVIAPYQRDGEAWLEAIAEVARASEECALLTGSDRGSELLCAAALPGNVHAFERGSPAHGALMDKTRAGDIALRAGVRVPWYATLHGEADLARVTDQAPWPCVVKPALSHQWRELYGEERAFLVENGEHAHRVVGRPLAAGLVMVLTQYIPGGDDHVEEAIVVRGRDGDLAVHFGCRKLRQDPPGFGSTAVGESSPLPETLELAVRVLGEAGFVGVAGVEAKRHAETGERWFLEANVRLPAQWGLGDACGVEASRRLVGALCGRASGAAPQPRPGVRFMRPEIHWRGVLQDLKEAPARRRGAVAVSAIRPYFGAGETGLLDLRDPGPLLPIASGFVLRRLRRLFGRPSAPAP